MRPITMLAAAAAGALSAGAASAAHLSYYAADLTPLNDSGVSGGVFLTYDGPEDDGMRSLLVQVRASGLEPGLHPGHVHGFTGSGGSVQKSIAPIAGVFDPLVDGDGDGFVELTEGAPFYGGILQTFTGLTADATGSIVYNARFDVAAGSQLDDDVYALSNRETVLHGLTTDFAVEVPMGFPGGNVDQDSPAPGTYNALLPIATGEFRAVSASDIPPVPLPAGIWMMGAALVVWVWRGPGRPPVDRPMGLTC